MYFRKNDIPMSGGVSVEGFSFDAMAKTKGGMWIHLLILLVLIIIVFLLIKSRKQKPRFGLRFL